MKMTKEEAITKEKAVEALTSLNNSLRLPSYTTLKAALTLAIQSLEAQGVKYECQARIDYQTCHIHEYNEHGCIGCGNYTQTTNQ
jgi:hypothetical protein